MYDPMLDSREGFDAEYAEYLDAHEGDRYYDDATESEYEFDTDPWGDPIEPDGQPDEYTEWQDYMGGDDWDHGQYDWEPDGGDWGYGE